MTIPESSHPAGSDPNCPSRKESTPPGESLDEICLANPREPLVDTHPSVPAIHTAAVFQCDSTRQADEILGGQRPGFAYQRDAHPNAVRLAEKCRKLHGARWAGITSSGMSSLAAIVLGTLQAGDHILVSNQLYGRSSVMLEQQIKRFGISVDVFDPFELAQLPAKHQPGKTRLIVAETIANPLLRVMAIDELVRIAKKLDCQTAIDNTFATPFSCQPLRLGIDWVWESYSKMLNGHSDVMLGMVAGNHESTGDVARAISTWGLSSAPFECYLAERGLTTFGLRIRQSIENARLAAAWLSQQSQVAAVHYPGLSHHPDHQLLPRILNGADLNTLSPHPVAAAGNVVTFELAFPNGQTDYQSRHSPQVDHFLQASGIPYYPSLGECNTTLSHPCSSSHRHLSPDQRQQLGISANTLRLCLGIEPWQVLQTNLRAGLQTG